MPQCDDAHCGMHEWKILQIKKLENFNTKNTMNFVGKIIINDQPIEMEYYTDIPVDVVRSRIISPWELHTSINIYIRSTDNSRGPRHGVDPLVSWSSRETKFWRISSCVTSIP